MSLLTNRKMTLDTQNMNENPINYEQNEWVREKLTEIWGGNKADYFVNPNRAPRKSSQDIRIEEDVRNISNSKSRTSRTGLYAYMIWDNLRMDHNGNGLKFYSLEKDLHNLNYYEKVKEQLAEDFEHSKKNKKKQSKKLSSETTKLNNTFSDTSRMKKNKILRNEIELMYRSSKMNEEKVNMMRANVPLPDMNDNEGKHSILRYLPPIINLNNDIERPLRYQQNSSLEFVTSPVMRKKYKKRLELLNKNEPTNFQMIDSKETNNSTNKSKLEVQNVKLHFLSERPAREYLNEKQKNEHDTHRSSDISNSDDIPQLQIVDSKPSFHEKIETALVPYDSKSVTYPPLSLNALMEYRPLIKAPGNGDFDNGQPKLFKMIPK